MEIKVRAHTCYIGRTGFAAHARGFFRNLSSHVDLRVRNYTWDDTPENHLVAKDYQIIDWITLNTTEGSELDEGLGGMYKDFPLQHVKSWRHLPFKDFSKEPEFVPDVDIVLMDTNHYYFYEKPDPRVKIRIAYLVYETTRLEENFYKVILKNFTHIFVPTKWHREMMIQQGCEPYRIFVVPEGIDAEFHDGNPTEILEDYNDERFKFLFFGRWDYRKAVPEILQSFLEEFKAEEPVDFILSADNLFSIDGMSSTEERLEFYKLNDPRIKVKHFPSREDYVNYIKTGHVLVTCARSEGWNIPLAEAIAAGTPVIYSNYGAQLEFAEGIGTPVAYAELRKAELGSGKSWFQGYLPGDYCEPDYEDLKRALRETYEHWSEKKEEAQEAALRIRKDFSWERIGEIGYEYLQLLMKEDIQYEETQESLVAILAHPDTEERKSYLEICNHEIKKQGYKTLISSHFPSTVNADYIYIDKNNPVVEFETHDNKVPFPQKVVKGEGFELHLMQNRNYGYTVLQLIKNACSFAISKGYDRVHFVNYDYLLFDNKTLNTIEEQARETKEFFIGLSWGEKYYGTGLFSVEPSEFLKAISKITTQKDYFNYTLESHLLESVITSAVNDHKKPKSILEPYEIKGKSEFNLVSSFNIPHLNTGSGRSLYTIPCYTDKKEFFLCIVDSRGSSDLYNLEILQNDKTLALKDVDLSSPKFIKIDREIAAISWVTVKDLTSDTSKEVEWLVPPDTATLEISEGFEFLEMVEDVEVISFHFVNGPYLEISTKTKKGKYLVEFIDQSDNSVVHSGVIEPNHWIACNREYYVDWLIRATDIAKNKIIFEHKFDLTEKRVFISIESGSLGDSVAWFAPIEEFQQKHNCTVIVSTFKNDLFRSEYPNIQFVERGVGVQNLYTAYKVGWFYDGDSKKFNPSMHPRHFIDIPMQDASSEILGLETKQYRPRISKSLKPRPVKGKYVCIGIHSTAQAKYWNHPNAWQDVVDYLKSEGYEVILISKESGTYMGNVPPTGIIDKSGEIPLSDRISDIAQADAYIGVGSGLSWLAWAIGTPVIMISGFSKPYTEFSGEDVLRISNQKVCNGCFNRDRLDAGDWNWCPDHKNTSKQFECTSKIEPKTVIEQIKQFLK